MNDYSSLLSLIPAALLLVPAIYLGVLALASLLPRQRDSQSASIEKPRIGVVIPAHNESLLLPSTLQALEAAKTDRAEIEVHVIADNCTDDTAEIGRAHGAEVAVRLDAQSGRGKPFALRWFFETRKEVLAPCDYLVLVDADTQVAPGFFNAVVEGMEGTAEPVAQAYYGASNVGAGWRAALSEVALAVSHHLRPLGRNRLGSTAGLKGNGMVFRSEFLLERGWESDSLVEDLEQSLLLLERGIRVRYLPGAIVRGEMASGAEAAADQRKRWEGGRFGLFRQHLPRLGRQLGSRNAGVAFEAMLDLVTPPLVAYLGILGLAGLGFWIVGATVAAAAMGVACLALLGITVQAMVMARVPRECWFALAKAPFFVAWKFAFYLKGGLARLRGENRGSDEWVRTARDGESESHEVASDSSPAQSVAASRISLLAWRVQGLTAAPLKRMADVLASGAALLVLSPLFAVTALIVYLEDRGPVFFKQTRVGLNGRRFSIWKFRSMYTDAEARKAALSAGNQHGSGVTFKMKHDPRITRIGKYLRKFSIDELPQFFNVLLGDMTLIGPRPPVPAEVACYRSIELRRLRVKPGLSCLWQVEGRAEIDFVGQVKLDLQYIHTASLLEDLKILLRTIPAVLGARGAY